MRTGKNPAKSGIPAYAPHSLGVALLVYIPFTEGYFKDALEILKYQIASLHAATPQPFNLLVFDNGSCPPVVKALNQLLEQQQIDWLVLSRHNLGKTGAWNWIFGSLPNELICYADSDVLFRPGWLEASLEILQAFPAAGMVTAQPNFYDSMEGQGKAALSLADDERYQVSEYLPAPEIIDEYCYGIGADEELSARFRGQPLPSVTDRQSGVCAVVGASHMQFLIPREVARQVAPLPVSKGLFRKETTRLDFKLDALGYLHLSARDNYVFHMGNTINAHLLAEVKNFNGQVKPSPAEAAGLAGDKSAIYRLFASLARRPQFNQLFLRVYNFLFRVLYAKS